MTAFADLLSIQRACSTLGLDTALSRTLVGTARPTIWFRHGDPVADAAVATGSSKVGGEPDLPPGMVWPTRPALADPDGTAEKLRASVNMATPCTDFVINHLAR
ncbi:hypothetical protein GAO09_12825 [Rhizobiales bacterium RZME27]|uniref:Uncharacterized protein n=1 Tax=Endobacterium cereale TaxID=2663029 RepID=A0A6A8A843_9HYPH|nr:hypothetical protein [Endobacterium cereale]MEB2844323.1 hypothetical protein [Endobacterium cereale]MQY46914.1 hypothetical protein [Endobacterium cereale]